MGLDVWFREDVARVIEAVYQASTASLGMLDTCGGAGTEGQRAVRDYQRGFVAALRAVAAGFGLAANVNLPGQGLVVLPTGGRAAELPRWATPGREE